MAQIEIQDAIRAAGRLFAPRWTRAVAGAAVSLGLGAAAGDWLRLPAEDGHGPSEVAVREAPAFETAARANAFAYPYRSPPAPGVAAAPDSPTDDDDDAADDDAPPQEAQGGVRARAAALVHGTAQGADDGAAPVKAAYSSAGEGTAPSA